MNKPLNHNILSAAIRCALLTQLGLSTLVLANEKDDHSTHDSQPADNLDTIVVTASSGGITPSITQQVVEKSTILDMKDILQDLPSLSVSGGNGVAQQLYIRNLGENEITFTVDGVPTNSAIFHHQSRFMFDPALLKTLEVQKGTGAASAGIGVTSGAIRMTTVDAKDMLKDGQTIGGMAGAGYSSNNGWSSTLAAYGRSASLDAIFMANRVKQNNYEDGDGNDIPYSEMTQQAYLGKLGWDINENNRLSLSHRREQNTGDLALRNNLIGTFRNGTIFDTDTAQETTTFTYESYDLGTEGSEVNATLYYGKVSDNRRQIDKKTPRLPEIIDSAIKKHGADLSVLYPIGDHALVSGVNYRKNKSLAKQFTAGSGAEDKTEYGVFTEMRWDLEPVTLTTGLRYDAYKINNNTGNSTSDNLVSPSIAAVWAITDSFSLNASWSQAIHSPTLEESLLLTLRSAAGHDFADNLTTGKAQTAELGFEWKSDNGFVVGASIYDQRIKDYIRTIYDANDIGIQTNDGELSNRGYEVTIGYRNDHFKAYLGMSHNNPKLNDQYYGYALDVIPTGTKYNASVSYQFDNPKLELGARARYVSEYQYRESGETQDRTAPDYFITDAFISWQPLNDDSLSINAGIYNITNEQYYNQSNFRTARFGVNDYSNWNPEKGREYRVGFKYKF